MRPFFLNYKSIKITWFTFFTIFSVSLSYFIAGLLAKEYEEDKNKIGDIFLIVLIMGFIGARLSYVMMNFNLYKDNLISIFKITHYNLYLIGGIISGLLALIILSRIYRIELEKLFKILIVPFYFSMAIGIWVLAFDRTLIVFHSSKILYLSLLFTLGMILELILWKKLKNKYISIVILTIVILLYYLI